MKLFFELTKPRIVFLILVTTAFGYFLGSPTNFSWSIFLPLIVGTAFSAGGAGALNNFIERETDAKMIRTMKRAIPSGAISAANALAFGIILTLLGTFLLVYTVNLLTGFLALLTTFLYVLVYTPLKRMTWLNTAIGAIPGAIPPLGGWAAATGEVTIQAWILFFILFVWQHPHFFSIAWMYRDDYERGGFKMLPVIEPDGSSTFRHIVYYSILLIPVSILPTLVGMSGIFYSITALIMGLLLLRVGLLVNKTRTVADAKRMLKATVIYLPLLLVFIVIDAVIARADLPEYGSVSEFSLTDQNGAKFSISELKGKPYVVNFFFTSCPSICPKIMKNVKELKVKTPEVKTISITVDPDNDTAQVLKSYAEKLGLTEILLTGDDSDIKRIAVNNLKVGVGDEIAAHTTRLVLVDGLGKIRGYYSALDQNDIERLGEDFNSLSRKQ